MKQLVSWNSSHIISELIRALQNNELVLSTTDTVLGLLAPLTQIGFKKLNAVKGRQEKPYLILLSDQQKLAHFIENYPPFLLPILDACWPGPLTIVFNARTELPSYMVSKTGTIALRVPGHAQLRTLLKHFNGLFSTSANMSGQPVATTVDEIDPALQDAVAYIVAGAQENAPTIQPSTIIDCTQEKIKVLREGAYDVDFLKKISGEDIFELS